MVRRSRRVDAEFGERVELSRGGAVAAGFLVGDPYLGAVPTSVRELTLKTPRTGR